MAYPVLQCEDMKPKRIPITIFAAVAYLVFLIWFSHTLATDPDKILGPPPAPGQAASGGAGAAGLLIVIAPYIGTPILGYWLYQWVCGPRPKVTYLVIGGMLIGLKDLPSSEIADGIITLNTIFGRLAAEPVEIGLIE